MPEQFANAEVTRSLQQLLRTRAANDMRKPEMIISCAPQVWVDIDLGDSLIIDIARVLGVPGLWSGGLRQIDSQLEEFVFRQLVEAGWPAAMLHSQYRADAKSGRLIDIAVLDEQGEVLLAIEVTGRHLGRMVSPETVARQVFAISQARRVCVTNGDNYVVLGRDGNSLQFHRAPGPGEVGIEVGGGGRRTRGPSSIRPDNLSALRAVMEEHAPKRIVIDFTLPWGHRLNPDAPLSALLPDRCTDTVRGPLESTHVLLAWFASLGGVESIASISPPALAFAQAFHWLRDWLMEQVGLAAHIELPSGLFAPMSAIGASFLLLEKTGDVTYFDSVSDRSEMVDIVHRPWYQSFLEWQNGREPETGFTKPSINVVHWTSAQNDPSADAVRERLAKFGPNAMLGELVEIIITRPFGRAVSEGDVQIIDARRIRSIRHDDEEPVTPYVARDVELREREYLQPGDVLLPRMRTPAARAFIFDMGIRAVAGNSVFVLRPTGSTTPHFIAEYLNSKSGQQLLDSIATGSDVRQVLLAGLRTLPVPRVSIDIAQPLEDTETAQDELMTATAALQSRRLELFDSTTAEQFADNLRELQRRSNLLASSLRLADSLEFQISQLFPFPVAYGYRLLAGYVDPRERFLEQLRVAENILAFLGSVCLALLGDDDRHTLANDLRKSWQGGISPGHWRTIITSTSKLLQEYKNNPLASSLSELNAGSEKKGLGKEFHFLITTKNDVKHDRGPRTESDIVKASEDVQSSLERCMQFLSFWTSHPIRQIRSLDAERMPGRVRLQCLRIQGDHPGFRQEEVRWRQALKKGDLYVEAGEDLWVLLHPYVERLTCHHCKAEEIYFVDRWDGARKAVMKSFERGHTEESDNTAKELGLALPKPAA